MEAKSILIPVTGHKVDEEALKLAFSLQKKHKSRIFVLHVIEVHRTLPLDAQVESEAQRGEAILKGMEKLAEDEGHKIETQLLQAREAGPALVQEAVERQAELMIMGMSYRKPFGLFSLGQTIQYVLKNAPCAVWLLREPIEGATQ